MNTKIFSFDLEAREKLLAGIRIIAKAVGSTLGPKGNNVAIERRYGSPNVVHDGVTVAREVILEDKFENMGADIVREAASSTNDKAGDGTTTSTILAEAITTGCMEAIKNGANSMILRSGIEKAVKRLVYELKKVKTEVTSPDKIRQVAIISAQDEEIGSKIAEAVNKVGKDGVVTVEPGSKDFTEVEYKEGMQFERGYLSPYFVTNLEKMEAEIEEPYIVITDQNISNVDLQLVPFLDRMVSNEKITSFVIIAPSVEGDALKMLIANKVKGLLRVLCVGAPGFGDRRKEMLQDIAIVTGGELITEDSTVTFENIQKEQLGRAMKVVANKDETLIIDGQGVKEKIDQRIVAIKNLLEKETSQFDREKLQERLSKLISGVAVIHVGANTSVELREKKERVIDAVNATQAAMAEGIVPGGETALLRIRPCLDKVQVLYSDERLGVEIMKKALEAPFRVLMSNSGYDPDSMLELVSKARTNEGVDVMDGKLKNLIKSGVIDPVRVTRCALENAASVAVMVSTTNTLIAYNPKEKIEE